MGTLAHSLSCRGPRRGLHPSRLALAPRFRSPKQGRNPKSQDIERRSLPRDEDSQGTYFPSFCLHRVRVFYSKRVLAFASCVIATGEIAAAVETRTVVASGLAPARRRPRAMPRSLDPLSGRVSDPRQSRI